MKRLYSSLLMLLTVGLVVTVNASLLYIGPITVGGAGVGAVNTVLTMQASPSASGCVAFNGFNDVVGPAACPPGIPGGAEKTGASQTQTRSIAELGIVNAASIRVIFNANEPNSGPVTLTQLVLRIYHATTGAVIFSGSLPAPIPFPVTNSGTGTSGFGFALDPPQALAAQAGFANPANRIGLSALNTGSAGGPGTFYLANITTALPPCVITITPITVGVGVVGTAYSRTLTATGGTAPYTFAVVGGALPPGVTLSSTGVLAGTPTTAGPFSFTVRGTDANGCMGDLTIVLPVALAPCAVAITPITVGEGVVGTAYSRTLTATGGTAPYTFAVVGGALPPGVTLSSTGVLAGTPTTAGTFTFTIRGTDAIGCMGDLAIVLPVIVAVPTLPQVFVLLLAVGLLGIGYYRVR